MSTTVNGRAVGQSSKGVVTTADVYRWKAERETLSLEIQALNAQFSLLARKIEAAAILFPDLDETAFELRAEPAAQDAESQGADLPRPLSLSEEVALVLASAGRPLAPVEIREALTKRGHSLSQNYLYTAIKRGTARGKIQHYGKKYRLPRTSSPQGETGGVAPPAS